MSTNSNYVTTQNEHPTYFKNFCVHQSVTTLSQPSPKGIKELSLNTITQGDNHQMTNTYKVEITGIKCDSKIEAGLHAIRLISKTINGDHSEGDQETFITEE